VANPTVKKFDKFIYWHVMDGRTDIHLVTAQSALCIALCSKKWLLYDMDGTVGRTLGC